MISHGSHSSPIEVACYSHVKNKEDKSQRHERMAWKCPSDVSIFILELHLFFAIYIDLCL